MTFWIILYQDTWHWASTVLFYRQNLLECLAKCPPLSRGERRGESGFLSWGLPWAKSKGMRHSSHCIRLHDGVLWERSEARKPPVLFRSSVYKTCAVTCFSTRVETSAVREELTTLRGQECLHSTAICAREETRSLKNASAVIVAQRIWPPYALLASMQWRAHEHTRLNLV